MDSPPPPLPPVVAPNPTPGKSGTVSVFVSRKEGKLFVRHGFEPLFNAPVTIESPDLPLGTHVFTALELKDDGAAMRWNVVSLSSEPAWAATSPSSRRASASSAGARSSAGRTYPAAARVFNVGRWSAMVVPGMQP